MGIQLRKIKVSNRSLINRLFQGAKLLLIFAISLLIFSNFFSNHVLANKSDLSNYSQVGYFSCSKGSNISGDNGFSAEKLLFLSNFVDDSIISSDINSLPILSGCPKGEVLDFHLNISDLYNDGKLKDGINIAPTLNLALITAKEARLKMTNQLREKTQKQHSYISIPQGNFMIETPPEKLYNLGVHRGNLHKKITRTGNKPYEILAHMIFLESNTSIVGISPNLSPESSSSYDNPENLPTPLVNLTLKDSLDKDAFGYMQFLIANPSGKFQDLYIRDIGFILPKALSRTKTVTNGAILLQDVNNGEISGVKILSSKQEIYGAGIHLLGVKDISLSSLNIIRRSSPVSTFYATRLKIKNSSFKLFNEAIDIDKGGYEIEINNNFFGEGSRKSNEAIDSNGTDGMNIIGNKFNNNGRILFFNGKGDLAPTWNEWVNDMYPNDDNANGVFIGGKNLNFSFNTITSSSYKNDKQRSLIVLGNKWTGNPHPKVPSVVNVNFSNNTYDSSGGFIIQECLDCNFTNETHTNAQGKFFIDGFSEPSADGNDSSLILNLNSVIYETGVNNTLFENILSLRNIGSINIKNSDFKTSDNISSPLCRMRFDSFRKDSIYNNPSSPLRVFFDNVNVQTSKNLNLNVNEKMMTERFGFNSEYPTVDLFVFLNTTCG